jgi:hypothetical protein
LVVGDASEWYSPGSVVDFKRRVLRGFTTELAGAMGTDDGAVCAGFKITGTLPRFGKMEAVKLA